MKTGILLFGDNFDYPTLLVAMARALDVKADRHVAHFTFYILANVI